MAYRQVTPPSAIETTGFDDFPCPGGSASTTVSYLVQDWSPATMMTNITTPDKSPHRVRDHGARLLPRPRDQDQILEPLGGPLHAQCGHHRASSMPGNPYYHQFGGSLAHSTEFPYSPLSPMDNNLGGKSPATSIPSPHDSLLTPDAPYNLQPQRPSANMRRSPSASYAPSHNRSVSTSSATAQEISRYGYPYRQPATTQSIGLGMLMSRPPTAMSHLTPLSTVPTIQMQPYTKLRRTASPPANPSRLSAELDVPDLHNGPTTSVLQYLTSHNPCPSLIQRITEPNRHSNTHAWFDIRNLRAWTDFTPATLTAMPSMLKLLNFAIPTTNLPPPPRVNPHPETQSHLADLCARHHAIKVNAALRVAQGPNKHMAMRHLTAPPPTSSSTANTRQNPEFVASYQSDAEKTIYGDGRGRVVGVVKCYEQWNSGMRHGDPNTQVEYLRHLAHLHRFMREHGTRYGFIITEIELVCVRMGGREAAEGGSGSAVGGAAGQQVPLFGYLEVAAPVQVSEVGLARDGGLKWTVGLALWYLHMLAKEQPFPGQFHWKLDVGAPAAVTRRHHLERDAWMPKVTQGDKREVKRARGWVMPDEPLHKKENGRPRTRKGKS